MRYARSERRIAFLDLLFGIRCGNRKKEKNNFRKVAANMSSVLLLCDIYTG